MKRATIYIQDDLHRALRLKALEADKSISFLVNEAVRGALDEDLEDLTAIEQRSKEKPISYPTYLKELKKRGQI